MMEISLAGQSALVTGASSGIGLAVAQALAAAGARVVFGYHEHPGPAQEAAAEVVANGGIAFAFGADVSREAEVTRLVDEAAVMLDGLDIVVANAGVQDDAPAGDLTLAQWDHAIGVDLTGGFLCGREAIRRFRRQGRRGVSRALGKLLFTSSAHQLIPWAGHVGYTAAKGGVEMMMRTLAQEVAGEGIRVNAIAPGAIRTNINRETTKGEAGEKLRAMIPCGRIGEPEDIANAACWVLSDRADYVVGTTLFVDGGVSLYPSFRGNG